MTDRTRAATKYIKGYTLKNTDRAAAVLASLQEHLQRMIDQGEKYGDDASEYDAGWADAILSISKCATDLQNIRGT